MGKNKPVPIGRGLVSFPVDRPVPISVVPAFSTVWAVFGKNVSDACAMRVVAWAMDAVERPYESPAVHATPLVEMYDPDGTFFGIKSVEEFGDFKRLVRVESEEAAVRVAFSGAKA